MIEIQTILCPVDLTPLSERAAHLAASVCQKVGARLVLEHNLDSRPPSYLGVSWMWSGDQEGAARDKDADATAAVRKMLSALPSSIEREAKITRGPIVDSLLRLTELLPADLMVMGTHGPSDPEHRSLTERVILQAPCPVLTLGEGYDPESVDAALSGTRPESLNVVVPADFTDRSRRALTYGLALAERMPHRIIIVHVAQPEEAGDEVLEGRRRELAAQIPETLLERTSIEVRVGEPGRALLQAAEDHRAIFLLMGAHGKSLLKRFLFGTTTLSVLHGATCPVLFIPQSLDVAG